MTRKLMIVMAAVMVLLPGCKKETWLDWRVQNQLWLEHISQRTNVVTTPTGLRYKVLHRGDSTQMRPDDLKSVSVTYVGSLIGSYNDPYGTDGKVFDSAEEATLEVSSVIAGFAEGLKKMYPTAHYILYIPYDLAYGQDGSGTEGGQNYIPPYSTLVFDIKLERVY